MQAFSQSKKLMRERSQLSESSMQTDSLREEDEEDRQLDLPKQSVQNGKKTMMRYIDDAFNINDSHYIAN